METRPSSARQVSRLSNGVLSQVVFGFFAAAVVAVVAAEAVVAPAVRRTVRAVVRAVSLRMRRCFIAPRGSSVGVTPRGGQLGQARRRGFPRLGHTPRHTK